MIDVPKALRVLIIEDSEDDAELAVRQITRAGYELAHRRVDSAAGVNAALLEEYWDLVISDYAMSGFNGLEALQILKRSGLDLPFILISGTIGEEVAVEAMKAGASDYLMKGNLARLVPAIERELREAAIRAAKRRIEEERIVLIERLQQALLARDEFLLIASHELKTPVTSLRLHVELMKRIESQDLAREAKRRLLREHRDAIEQQIDRLAKLIDHLLDVSRISVGRLVIEPSQVDLARVVRDAVEGFRAELAKARCDIEVGAGAPVIGQWDPLRMEQIVVNLLGNAIKYAGGCSITVSVELTGGKARLVVQDRGPGIAPGDQERIFQRFERAVSSERVGGFGLGLYITRQIVLAHGGSIRLESAPGKGSRFIVELPLTPASVSRRAA